MNKRVIDTMRLNERFKKSFVKLIGAGIPSLKDIIHLSHVCSGYAGHIGRLVRSPQQAGAYMEDAIFAHQKLLKASDQLMTQCMPFLIDPETKTLPKIIYYFDPDGFQNRILISSSEATLLGRTSRIAFHIPSYLWSRWEGKNLAIDEAGTYLSAEYIRFGELVFLTHDHMMTELRLKYISNAAGKLDAISMHSRVMREMKVGSMEGVLYLKNLSPDQRLMLFKWSKMSACRSFILYGMNLALKAFKKTRSIQGMPERIRLEDEEVILLGESIEYYRSIKPVLKLSLIKIDRLGLRELYGPYALRPALFYSAIATRESPDQQKSRMALDRPTMMKKLLYEHRYG